MRAASRQSYATAVERLDQLIDAATPQRVWTAAEDILAVADLLSGQPRLRRALSDPARSGEDRVALLRGLLAGKAGDDATELLSTLVAGRWSAAAELLEACELLGVQAVLASAELAGELAEVEDELFRFGQIVTGDAALAAAVGDTRVPVRRRAELLSALLEGRSTRATVRLGQVALGGFGGRSLSGALTRLVELAAQRRDRYVAYVTVASPLPEAQEQRLGATLAARYGREVSVKTTVDPRVIGGMRVQVGADLYDGTVARRLAVARTALVSS